jgi:hypothetical protein
MGSSESYDIPRRAAVDEANPSIGSSQLLSTWFKAARKERARRATCAQRQLYHRDLFTLLAVLAEIGASERLEIRCLFTRQGEMAIEWKKRQFGIPITPWWIPIPTLKTHGILPARRRLPSPSLFIEP